jgi:predicted transcriptional regulator
MTLTLTPEQLAANRAEISAAIEEGVAQAERGELLEPGEVRARIAVQKKAWLAQNRRS